MHSNSLVHTRAVNIFKFIEKDRESREENVPYYSTVLKYIHGIKDLLCY